AGCNVDAAAVAGEGEETADLLAGLAVEDLDVTARSASACPRDDVLNAVAGDVADRHADSARVVAIGRQRQAQRAVGVEHADVAGRSCIRRHRQEVRHLGWAGGRRQGSAELEGAEVDAAVSDANEAALVECRGRCETRVAGVYGRT